jgi:Xaa-Pro dipeptidase
MNYLKRIQEFQERLKAKGLAGAILFHSRDILYYTGTAQPSHLVILPHDFRLFITAGINFALRESGLPPGAICLERNLGTICRQMFPGDGQGCKVGSELDLLSVNRAAAFAKALDRHTLVDCSDDILDQRKVKEPDEIKMVEAACDIAAQGHAAAMDALRPGMSELEFAACIENGQRLAGHEGMYFMRRPDVIMSRGPVAAGPNLREISGFLYTMTGVGLGPAMPVGPSRYRIQADDLILVDIPPLAGGYHADQSRMYCAGRPTSRAVALYAALRAVADGVISQMRPGMTCDAVYRLALDRARENGLADSFLAFPDGKKAHFVGHGLGIELNEPPLLAKGVQEVLKADMILALEMHLMEKDNGHTLKLEDTLHLTAGGSRILTRVARDIHY